MRRPASLRRHADFARLRRRGRRIASPNLTMFRSDAHAGDLASLVGISVGKSIGKAVVRNKLRRRLSAILRELLAPREAMRLLVVPRPGAERLGFAALAAEVATAVGRA